MYDKYKLNYIINEYCAFDSIEELDEHFNNKNN